MANILIGTPCRIYKNWDLVGFLEVEGHQVTYVQEPSEMIAEINRTNLPQRLSENLPKELRPKDYDVIICDTRLFYQGKNITDLVERTRIRTKLFKERVVNYLDYSNARKIIIADNELAKGIEELVKQKGFTQMGENFSPGKITDEIRFFLKSKDN